MAKSEKPTTTMEQALVDSGVVELLESGEPGEVLVTAPGGKQVRLIVPTPAQEQQLMSDMLQRMAPPQKN